MSWSTFFSDMRKSSAPFFVGFFASKRCASAFRFRCSNMAASHSGILCALYAVISSRIADSSCALRPRKYWSMAIGNFTLERGRLTRSENASVLTTAAYSRRSVQIGIRCLASRYRSVIALLATVTAHAAGSSISALEDIFTSLSGTTCAMSSAACDLEIFHMMQRCIRSKWRTAGFLPFIGLADGQRILD